MNALQRVTIPKCPPYMRRPIAAILVLLALLTSVGFAFASGPLWAADGPAPEITSLNPNSGSANGGTMVTISGNNFTGATTVTFGGTMALFTVENSHTITATAPAHLAATVDVVVTTADGVSANTSTDDFTYIDANVTISETGGSTNVTEGGATDSYLAVLAAQPTGSVTITVTSDGQLLVNPTTLTFSTTNWNVVQSVTVTAVDDAVVEGSHTATITHSASGGGYSGLSIANVTVHISDNDAAGVSITESGGSTRVSEGGGSDAYTVALTSQPSSTVTVTVTAGSQLTVNPSTLLFSPTNWNIAQSVSVVAVDDTAVQGARTVTIAHSAADGGYGGVTVPNVVVTITDNDAYGVTITESGGDTRVAEGGVSDSYTVILAARPTGTVAITISGTADLSLTPSLLVFTEADWNVPQSVTVRAVDDTTVEATQTAVINHSASGDGYSGIAISQVRVTTADNDTAPPPSTVTLHLRGGLELIGWPGVSISSQEILLAYPRILRIWAWDYARQQWILDDPTLPERLRVEIPISRGVGFFVVTSGSMDLVIPLA